MNAGTIIGGVGVQGLGAELSGQVHYGIQGPSGGYYKPSVTHLADDTLQFDFVPSKKDMPEVASTLMKIPVSADSGGNVGVNPTVYGLPVLYLTGDNSAMTKENAVTLDYIFGNLSGVASVKWQGSSSLEYPKKNYTIVFDQAFEAADGWGEQKKYCLKANYIDFSHARNVCSAKLWGHVVKSRENVSSKLTTLPNGGAVDGSPCIVMLNGTLLGLYTLNIPKDGWMYGMTDDSVEEQTEILNFKTYTNEKMPDIITGEYEAVNTVTGVFVTQNSTLNGGRSFVNWDTTQINKFRVMAYLFDAAGSLVKVFGANNGDNANPYVGKTGDFAEDAWYNCPLSSTEPFQVTGPFSIPVPAGHTIMWALFLWNDIYPEGSALTRQWSEEADKNNTWSYKWVKTGVEFSIRNNRKSEMILCAKKESRPTYFLAEATLSGDFEIEYASETVSEDAALTSLNRLITACINSDGTDLDSTIAKYLDWESAIDYYIYACLIGGPDIAVKNYLLSTYDGVKWLFGAYDMDGTFGLWWDGKRFLPDNHYPTVNWYAGNHKVMGLILAHKRDEFKSRYAELRAGALSENNVALVFSNYINQIPATVYVEDAKKWPAIPSTATNNLAQILNWYRMRVSVIDKEVDSL